MRLEQSGTIVLSRRNLSALLAKLDGHPPNSAKTLIGGAEAPGVVICAEEDDVHYAIRQPGPLHRATQYAMAAGDSLAASGLPGSVRDAAKR